MNNWFHHFHLEHLNNLVRNSESRDCEDYFEPLSRVIIDQRPVDLRDPALCKFMKAIGVSLDDQFKSLNDITNKLGRWSTKRHFGPATYDCSYLDELFELRTSATGWRELDRVLNHMAGVTLSHASDNPQILHNADDPGLHGDVCYSVLLQTYNFDSGLSKRKWAAIASSVDLIVPLALLAAQAEQAVYETVAALDEGHPDFSPERKRSQGEPVKMDVRKNGKRQVSIPLINSQESGIVEPIWRNLEVEVEDMAMMKALLAVAPEDAKQLVKGMFLEGQLGL
jgi:hypothetical protein